MSLSVASYGQLCDMTVESVRCTGHDPSGPVNKFNKKPFALLKLEIDDGSKAIVNGSPIRVLRSQTISPHYEDDAVYDGYAIAWGDRQATEVSLHHPDFNNCIVSLPDFLGNGPLQGGDIYTISLKIPSSHLLEAGNAFNSLDFTKAKELYDAIAESEGSNPEERIIAKNHLPDLDSLISYHDKAMAYERSAASKTGRNRDFDLLRARIFYKSIYGKSNVAAAALKVDEINNLLGIESADIKVEPINTFILKDASLAGNDLRAFGNEAVTYEYSTNGKDNDAVGKSALLIVNVPVNGAFVSSSMGIKPVEQKDGEFWVYVHSFCKDQYKVKDYWDSNPILFSIEHPDYRRLDFRLSDLESGEPPVAEKVYHIEFDSPTLVMGLANKMLSRLELGGAYNLYRYNFADVAEQDFATKMCAMLNSDSLRPLVETLEEETSDCDATDVEWNRILRGIRMFDSLDQRNSVLRQLNSQLSTKAGALAKKYTELYEAAKQHGVNLSLAYHKASDYDKMASGVRRIPMLVSFTEVRKVDGSTYLPEQKLGGTPTVRIEFRNGQGKKVDEIIAKIKDGSVAITPNIDASQLFIHGTGKMKISFPSDLNRPGSGSARSKYHDNEVEIADLRIPDYQIVKYNVRMTGK